MLETPIAPPSKPNAHTAPPANMRQGAGAGAAGFSGHLREALEPAESEAPASDGAAASRPEATKLTEADTPQGSSTDANGQISPAAPAPTPDMGGVASLASAAPMAPLESVTGNGAEAAAMAGLLPGQNAVVAPQDQSLGLAPSVGPLTARADPGAEGAEVAAQPLTIAASAPDLHVDPPSARLMAQATSSGGAALNAELAASKHDPSSAPDMHAALASAPLIAQATSRDGATPDALAAKAALRASTLAAEGAKPTDPAILLARAITAATAAQEAGQETPQLAAPVLGVAAKLVGLSAPQPPVSDVQDEVPQGQTPWLTPMDSAPRPADAPVPSQAARGESAPPTPTRQLAPVLVSMALGRGSDTLTISLDPIELGRVEVSISQGKEAGQVRIVAERPETLALLQRDQRELDRALSQAGLGELGRSIAFSLSSDQGRQQHQGWGQEKALRNTGFVISAEGDRGLAMVPTQNRASTSLIDLAV